MKNKFAIVTEASTGIGRATTIELGKNEKQKVVKY